MTAPTMRKLERTLREMKMEPVWMGELEPSELSSSSVAHRLCRSAEWDTSTPVDWSPESLDPDLTSHLKGDSRTQDIRTGLSSSPPLFGYSQKNFHIADGNLYSIFSPFQSRKPMTRPSFFRGQCAGDEDEDVTVIATSSAGIGSSFVPTSSGKVTLSADQSPRGGRSRRWKLKFHHQNVPPQYRTSGNEETETFPDQEKSSNRTNRTHSSKGFSSSTSSSTSSFSKRSFNERKEDSFFSRSASDGFDMDAMFASHMPKESEPFEALDLTRPRENLFRQDWEAFSNDFVESHRLRKSRARKSIFDDSDEDEDEPLNLCIADHVKRHRHKGVPIKVKREPAEAEKDKNFSNSPFTAARERFERRQRQFFANCSPSLSVFRSPSPDLFPARDSSLQSEQERDKYGFSDDIEAMDLTYNKQNKSEFRTFFKENVNESQQSTSTSDGNSTHSFKLSRGKKIPYISEMLENMSLWDEDFRGPLLMKEKPKEPQPTAKRKSHTSHSLAKSNPSSAVSTRNKSGEGEAGSNFLKPIESGSKAPQIHKTTIDVILDNKSNERTHVPAKSLEGNFVEIPMPSVVEHLAAPNYYVFLPNPILQPFNVSPTFVSPAPPPTVGPTRTHELQSTPMTIPITSIGAEHLADIGIRKTSSMTKLEAKPKSSKATEGLKHSRSGGMRPKRAGMQQQLLPDQPISANDISICKFKLIKGVQPVLEEKKSFFMPLPRANRTSMEETHPLASCSVTGGSQLPQKAERFRTYKIHVGSQEELGRKLAAGKKMRRRSRKALVREKLEATFREQGFLIKTQQVSSAEGAVYCKFRQLKKFTRYLFKSWRNYLPKDLEEISTSQSAGNIPSIVLDPGLPPLAEATLSLPDIPTFANHLCSPGTSRCSSVSGTSGLGTSILTDSGLADSATFVDSASVANLSSVDDVSMVTDATDISDSGLLTGISPCLSTCSLPCTSPSLSSIT